MANQERSKHAYSAIWSDAVYWILAKHVERGETKFSQSELALWVYHRDSQANPYTLLYELEKDGAIGPEHSGNYWKTVPGMNPLDSGGSEFTFAPDLREISPAKLRTIADRYCSSRSDSTEGKPDGTPPIPPGGTAVVPLFGMNIIQDSQKVKRKDRLGFDRECHIGNHKQWKLFLLAVKHSGTLSKEQVNHLLPDSRERSRTAARLREQLKGIQLTFVAASRKYVLKESSE